MTRAVRRGLATARDMLQRQLYVGEQSEIEQNDWLATIEWFNSQLAIDDRRRVKRGKYRGARA